MSKSLHLTDNTVPVLEREAIEEAGPARSNGHLPIVRVVSHSSRHCSFFKATLSPHFQLSIHRDVDQALNEEDLELASVVIIDRCELHDKNYLRFLAHTKRLKEKCPGLISMAEHKQDLEFSGDEHNTHLKSLIWPTTTKALLHAVTLIAGEKAERSWRELPPDVGRPLTTTVQQYQAMSDAIARGEQIDCTSVATSCQPLLDAVEAGKHHELLKAVQSHHNYTYVHSMRVATLLTLFGHGLGMKGDDLLILSTGGLIHDVGKLATPEHILNKPGKLTDEEWPVMRDHVVRSSELLSDSMHVTRGALIIAAQHHEKIDGSGYPKGLKGAELNELARMSAIVDIFGALTDKRSYKPAFAQEKAFDILTDMNTQIDQSLLKVFRTIFDQESSGEQNPD